LYGIFQKVNTLQNNKCKFSSITYLEDWWQETQNFIVPIFLDSSSYIDVTLSHDECNELINHANIRGYNIRHTLSGGSRDVHPSKELLPIQKIKNVVLEINKLTYKYELDEDNFECLIHKFQNGQGYCFHRDINKYRPYCKLAASVQLSRSEEYSGGDLIFFENEDPRSHNTIKKERGAITVFPSFCVHKVSTVTTGIRYSMILFFYGPPFR